ncbi:heat shock factor 2-binding protein isoform X3 [Canis lupus dingo]|uniref:heat shock factor 2-binding protein isoform X3 n=1 Tax=Canis lupus dingo TaxID=286419 RepID=UPI0020C3F40E|nr:heat shock factor 2-binding protein isoform X3 [Canis lupus dingo]
MAGAIAPAGPSPAARRRSLPPPPSSSGPRLRRRRRGGAGAARALMASQRRRAPPLAARPGGEGGPRRFGLGWRASPQPAFGGEHVGTKEEFVKVRKKDLERLTTEVMQIRDFLPRILNGEVLESFQKLKIVEKNLERKEQELEQLRMDCEHFKARLETVQADSMRDKKEKLALRQQLNEAKQQLLQQAEYCTEMGAAACTLLWGVSSSEDVVKAILGGDKALKFFSITGQTMESFVKSLDGDVKELDSDENQFVFALAGIVTNVAAIACGREFLVNSSRVLLDTILQLLGDLKPGQCTKLKVPRRRSVSSCTATRPVSGPGAGSLIQVGL